MWFLPDEFQPLIMSGAGRARNSAFNVTTPRIVDRIEDSLLWKLLEQPPWELLGWLFGLVFALALLFWLIFQIRAWFSGDDDPADGDHELLASIRELQREGDLTDDEYRSIKSRLIDRLDETTDPSG